MATLRPSCTTFANGVDPVAGTGKTIRLTITGNWVAGDRITLLLTDQTTGVSHTIGYGLVTGKVPTFGLTLDQKSYFVAGSSYFFSDFVVPTSFNEPTNPGSGSVDVANYYSTPEDLTALAQYQNGLAVFSTNFIQVWEIAAEPASYAKKQTLQNIGTRAPRSVQSLGYLDVIFLDDSGVRSIRARESNLDAESVDSGSPIDALIQAAIDAGSSVPDACAIIEPRSKMYWLYFGGTIYVFSQFRASKITAWSTFTPTYNVGGVQTPIVIEKFCIKDRQVFFRGQDRFLYSYGGANGATYDGVQVTAELPWLDDGSPTTNKMCLGLDASFEGNWKLEFGMDPEIGTLEEVWNWTSSTDQNVASTYDKKTITLADRQGTHFKVKATSAASLTSRAKLSALHLKYKTLETT